MFSGGCMQWLSSCVCGRHRKTPVVQTIESPDSDSYAAEQEPESPNMPYDTAIDLYVDELMLSGETNQAWIPDFVERRLYTNILKGVHWHIREIAKNTKIQVAGLEVKLQVS